MPNLLVAAAATFEAAYVALRTFGAAKELRSPAPREERNPQAYGARRRTLMLAGMARSLATLYAIAYGLGPKIAVADGETESRRRRLALSAAWFALGSLVDLPVDFIEDYALERRYGLSDQSVRGWLEDRAKASAVATVVGLPLTELLAYAIVREPDRWPAFATAAALPLLILASVIAPNVIMPMFNRFEPLEGDLEPKLRELAGRYGAGDAAILRVDMSKQTTKANAYVTGLFGSKRIVIGDTLLSGFADREVAFVVAHELGHYVSKDVWRSVALGTAAAGAIFFGARALALRGMHDPKQLGTTAGLARLAFSMSLLGTLAGPLTAAASRSRERAADEFAVSATSDPQGGAAAFVRLREQNMAEDEQPRWMEVLFSSHPSLKSRIAKLEALAGTGGG